MTRVRGLTPRVFVVVLTATVLLAGCGSDPRACTLVGVRPGVAVRVAPPAAADVSQASLEVCWGDRCRTRRLRLRPATTAVPQGCSGTGPSAPCGASASPLDAQQGFARVAELPTTPVRVTVVLRNASGTRVFEQSARAEPAMVFPNGPDCGAQGPQLWLAVIDDELLVRRVQP